jgi:hypothetical protein
MHKSIVWWSIWGLLVGTGLFGLKESQRESIHLILALPLLTGAIAAAFLRLKHEYHEAMLHAKWVALSSTLFLIGSGYLYLKAEAYGPFANASAHRAFMGTTFEMSVREVERAVGRRLSSSTSEHSTPEGLKEWVFEMLPDFDGKSESRFLQDVAVYEVPCKVRFDFTGGRLGRVEVAFRPTTTSDSRMLLQKVLSDVEKDYKRVDTPPPAGESTLLFRKESVDAGITHAAVDPHHQQISVLLQYLPLAEKRPGILTVNASAF